VLFGLWTRRTCTGGRGWGATVRDTGGIENRQGQLREGLRIGSLGVGSHGGHGIVLAATKQAAGAFGLTRPGSLGVDIPVLPVLGMLYAWLYVAHMWETLRPSVQCRVSPACIPRQPQARRELRGICKQSRRLLRLRYQLFCFQDAVSLRCGRWVLALALDWLSSRANNVN